MFVRHRTAGATWLVVALCVTSLSRAANPTFASQPAALRANLRIDDPASATVAVRLAYSHLPTGLGSLEFQMPKHHAFAQLDKPLIEGDVRAVDPNGEDLQIDQPEPFRWSVSLAGNDAVTLEYRVPLRHRAEPAVRGRDEYEYPYLADDHGMLTTATLVITPARLALDPILVTFDLPSGWQAVCPWPAREPTTFAPPDSGALSNDLIAIGHWAVHSVEAGGMQIDVAFAPGQETAEQAAVPLIQQIADAQLKLFDVCPAPKYLFLFGRPDTPGLGGSPKTTSMTLSVAPHIPPQVMTGALGHLIAHEFHHLWGSSRYRCPDELRFFNEGFTDYYAYLLLARNEITDWDAFFQALGRCMATCQASPLRERCSLVDAGGERFFTDNSARDLVYQGGLLVAALLDAQLRSADPASSLDDFMRSFNNDARWSVSGSAPTLDDFVASIEAQLGADQARRFRRLVAEPYRLDPLPEFAKSGVTVVRSAQTGPPQLRGNLREDAPTTLRNLDPNSVAYQLGVRAGDRFIKINGCRPTTVEEVRQAWSNPADGRVVVTIERDGQQMTIDEPVPERIVFQVSSNLWNER